MDHIIALRRLGHRLFRSLLSCFAMACFIGAFLSMPKVLADGRVFYTASDFDITEAELRQYMGVEEMPDGTIAWGSSMRAQHALRELYTLKVLSRAALQKGVLTESERAWIAYYQVARAAAVKLVADIVEEQMEGVDWSSDAREYYIANKPEFKEPDSISVRSFVISTKSRSALEALKLASEIIASDMTIDQFERVVREHTEDPNSVDGLIANLTRGMTVREFEEAAFSLTEIGQLSEPVLSRYGAHVIQLLGRNPSEYRTFESVEEQIITQLKQKRFTEFGNFARTEPHRDPPADVVVNQEVIDQLVQEIEAQEKATRPQLPTP
jgi:parvulin-like peptidyl-prolyl isomerase